MISWAVIAYGAALTAIAVFILERWVGRQTQPVHLLATVAPAVGGVVGWNAILHITSARQFFTDLPGRVFPISWQDFGSGVFAFAAVALVLGLGSQRSAPAHRAVTLAGLAGLGALLVDIYLY